MLNKLDIRMQSIWGIILMHFKTFWCINEVYMHILKCGNLPMTHMRSGKRWGMG